MENEAMDVTQALKDTENSLRDFISAVLQNDFGNLWIEQCGVTEERISIWGKRLQEEKKRQKYGAVEERILYYSDFYDLRTILKKHWPSQFSVAFGDWKTMNVWLQELEKLRDPDAHRRELLPHQKHLILGITGEIRTRLIRYRSKQETSEDYYPRIESARDNLGRVYSYGTGVIDKPKIILRVGDILEFVITATDPMGQPLEYRIYGKGITEWQKSNILSLKITTNHIIKNFNLLMQIKSQREYHAYGDHDDRVLFVYEVLPAR